MSAFRFAATDPVAEAAAEAAVFSGASAIGAALAGYMAAAGEHPGVLFSPMGMLVFAFGACRALDGRCRQPGEEARRPRGFTAEEIPPDAAYFAVPQGVTAAFVAMAYDESQAVSPIIAAGIARAKGAGAMGRASLIRRIRSLGPAALTNTNVQEPLLHLAGPVQGGLLTAKDFSTRRATDQTARRDGPDVSNATLRGPWADTDPTSDENNEIHSICALDGRGGATVLSYHQCTHGIVVPEYDLVAPKAAIPVRRGVSRVPPGTALEAFLPGTIQLERGKVVRAECRLDDGRVLSVP